MDADEPVFSPRARRAAPLIAAALTAVIVGSLLYLRPASPSGVSYKGPTTFPQLDGRHAPAFDFITPSLGWAGILDIGAGQVSVYRTSDGARHWQRTFVAQQVFPQGQSIHFFDSRHGWVYTGRLYTTADGGSHWTTISLPDATGDFTFPGPTKGWALDGLALYSTQDGGLTWRTAGRAPAAFYGMGYGNFEFRPDGEGWGGGGGLSPTVYATFDGGVTWRSILLPAALGPVPPQPSGKAFPAPYSTGVHLLPGNGAFAQEDDYFGQVADFITLDRGATWSSIKAPPEPASNGDISFLDSRHWWASRFGLIYKTSDAGRSWQAVHTTFPDELDGWNLNSAEAIDAKHAWLVVTSEPPSGRRSALMMSSDAGAHWSLVNLPTP